jgi:hypothetical protein
LIKFLAQTKLERVAVPIKPAQETDPIRGILTAQTHNAAAHQAVNIEAALIQATVKACHHRGILSNLFPNLNNQFSRSLLFVWYAHLPPSSKSSLICRFVIDAFAKAF